MTSNRPPKKSETLEVRLPHSVKAAFMSRCGETGRTASEAVRAFIEAELASAPGRARRTVSWLAVFAAAAGIAVGAVAAPSVAQSARDDATAFARLDTNDDGRLDLREFRAR